MEWLFRVAVVAGASYSIAAWAGWEGLAIIVWKALGVGLLALWAVGLARGRDGWTIAAVLALGALGDVLLDAVGLVAGASAFAAGHVLAILLYRRNRRAEPSPSQRLLGVLVAPLAVAIAMLLARGSGGVLQVGVYAALLGTMAGLAWTSRFPRYRVGLGAMLFVASDLLIFARMGPLAGSFLPALLVWPLYFAGQTLIARGVVTEVRKESFHAVRSGLGN